MASEEADMRNLDLVDMTRFEFILPVAGWTTLLVAVLIRLVG
jgi:hypothetical protein